MVETETLDRKLMIGSYVVDAACRMDCEIGCIFKCALVSFCIEQLDWRFEGVENASWMHASGKAQTDRALDKGT